MTAEYKRDLTNIPHDHYNTRHVCLDSEHDAATIMRRIGADARGIPLMSSKSIVRNIHMSHIPIAQANMIKQEMLSIGGDACLSWRALDLSTKTTDVLISGSDKHIHRLLDKLKQQVPGLRTIGDKIEQVLQNMTYPPTNMQAGDHYVPLSDKTCVMGIVNITPDSFSDAGQFLDPAAALAHAHRLVAEGADIIDIGGESSRPGAEPVSLHDELERVIPVIEQLARSIEVPISIDTYKPAVAEAAIRAGASIINDIYACRWTGNDNSGTDRTTAHVAAQFKVPIIIMHMQGTPNTMQQDPTYDDLLGEIIMYLRESMAYAISVGVPDDAIIIDPGIGFGKTLYHNLSIIKHIGELSSLGAPILVGPSRKRFIGHILKNPEDQRLTGTIAASLIAAFQGAHIVRVHDVKPVVEALAMADAIAHADAGNQ